MNKLICEYDCINCKVELRDLFTKSGFCQTHGKVFLYNREQLNEAYKKGLFIKPSERNKKKEVKRY